MDDVTRLSLVARARGLRIAVVESLTSGRLAAEVGAGEAAVEWFAGGVVAYMTDVKEHLLGVTSGIDPCSAECAEQMAAGAREMFGADICVSTTGVGGPGSEDGHPPGTVYLGWACEGSHGYRRLNLRGDPATVLSGTVAAAMRLLVARADELHLAPPTGNQND